MNKKAELHVEMIISFSIFIVFVIFIFIILNPFKQNDYNPTINKIVLDSIAENISIDVLTTSIKVTASPVDCFNIEDKFFPDPGMNLLVRSGSTEIGSRYNLPPASSLDIKVSSLTDQYYDIYFSSEFKPSASPPSPSCSPLASGTYNLGQTKLISFSSESQITKLESECVSHYGDLRNEFKLPSSRNFGFVVREGSGTKIAECSQNIPKNVDIYSSDKLIRIIYANGDIKTATLQVTVW